MDSKSVRAERREEIKLLLEYVKLVSVCAVIATVYFGVLQWRTANENARFANQLAMEAVYARMANEWRDHIKIFITNPDLRPYFENGKHLVDADENSQAVLAIADVRLDVMDAILTYAGMRDDTADIDGWKKTFSRTFEVSPVMCQRLNETRDSYGRIVPVGDAVCRPKT